MCDLTDVFVCSVRWGGQTNHLFFVCARVNGVVCLRLLLLIFLFYFFEILSLVRNFCSFFRTFNFSVRLWLFFLDICFTFSLFLCQTLCLSDFISSSCPFCRFYSHTFFSPYSSSFDMRNSILMSMIIYLCFPPPPIYFRMMFVLVCVVSARFFIHLIFLVFCWWGFRLGKV